MRLLIVASSFYPVIGGAESYATEIASALARRGHAVTVATDFPADRRPGERFEDPPGVAVHRFSRYRSSLEDPSRIPWEEQAYCLMPELLSCAERARPELILTNSLDAAMLGKALALEYDLPWVAAFHEHAPEDEALGAARLRLVYDVLRPSLVLAGSRFYAQRARRWSAEVPVETIHHGIDVDAFHPGVDGAAVRAAYGFGPEDPVIVAAGRLKARKGFRELVEAFARVHGSWPRARLLIVGGVSSASPAYSAALEDDVERLGLRRAVTIDRSVTFDRMPAVLAAADVVAQPSLEEGLGLSLLEAMSAGRPVVATDVVGHREVLTEPDVALIVPPARPTLLADALLALLARPELRQRLAGCARAHVEARFSLRRMASDTEAALQRALSSHPQGELAGVRA